MMMKVTISGRSNNNDGDLLPIIGGIVLGAGLLALLYFAASRRPANEPNKPGKKKCITIDLKKRKWLTVQEEKELKKRLEDEEKARLQKLLEEEEEMKKKAKELQLTNEKKENC